MMPPETDRYRLATITPFSNVSRTFDSAFSVIAGAALRARPCIPRPRADVTPKEVDRLDVALTTTDSYGKNTLLR